MKRLEMLELQTSVTVRSPCSRFVLSTAYFTVGTYACSQNFSHWSARLSLELNRVEQGKDALQYAVTATSWTCILSFIFSCSLVFKFQLVFVFFFLPSSFPYWCLGLHNHSHYCCSHLCFFCSCISSSNLHWCLDYYYSSSHSCIFFFFTFHLNFLPFLFLSIFLVKNSWYSWVAWT